MASIGFEGKVAIITGAGGGLGREHALELARRGARIVVNDLGGSVSGEGGDEGPAQRVVKEIEALGGEAVADSNSVASAEGGQAIVQTALDAFGTVDIVVNNAGVLRDKSFASMTPDLFEAVIAVHLLGAYYVTQPAFVVMKQQGYGRIVSDVLELRDTRQLRPSQLRRGENGSRRPHPCSRHRRPQVWHQGERDRPRRQDPYDRRVARRRP